MEYNPRPLPCLGGGDTDEGDRAGAPGSPGHGEWSPRRSGRGGGSEKLVMSPGFQRPAGTPELSSCGPTGHVVHPGQGPGRPCPGGTGPGGWHWDLLRLLSPRCPGEWWSPAHCPAHTLTLCPVPGSQTACRLPHRTALPSTCWPQTGTSSTSRLGKGPPGLAPASFLGCKELGGYPRGPHTESPPPRAVCPWCPLI